MTNHSKKAHFIGICGAGMSAVALLLKEMGWEVTGSDNNFYPPVSTYLQNALISFSQGYQASNLPENVDLVVIGKHAELTPELNEEVRAAFEQKLTIRSFAEVLGEVTQGRTNVVVAGSYGKSTCTALLAWCLQHAGKSPGYFIGAITHTPRGSSAVGTGKLFVLEGDEYPAANWDNRSKFLSYHPHYVLLTALAHDHVNIFKTEEDYRIPFRELFNLVPSDGLIVACADGSGVTENLRSTDKPVVFYSVTDTQQPWHTTNRSYGEITSFDIINNGEKVVSIETELLGEHNVENILGVGVLALSQGWLTPQQFAAAIKEFKAPQRRMDKLSSHTAIPIYEGFGSSADKAISAIKAMKLHYPSRPLTVVFEPHTFSWRSRDALPWYRTTFSGVDHLLVYKPPQHGAAPDQLTLSEILDELKDSNVSAIGIESPTEGVATLQKILHSEAVVLLLSSGGFDGMIPNIVSLLEKQYPRQ
jgi:UDP-N-acetylmuramate: L-alanyl-gamma-D-glutamyl-meso-diaminopimelate ligase